MNLLSPSRTSLKSIVVYIPVALKPSLIPKEQRPYAAYFLDLIHSRRCNWKVDPHGFVRLKWEYLVKVIPRDTYLPMRNRLIDLGVVEMDDTAHPGKQSYGFRITSDSKQ